MSGEEKYARAYVTPPQLVRYMPRLLAGVWSMSVLPETVLELLGDEECTAGISEVLDLGCGKGAIAICLARRFGFRVRGIDICAPFVEEARARARELGVDDICRFEHDDVNRVVRASAEHDMVLLIWMGGILGRLGESVGRIRRLVRPGGCMLIGEGCFKDGVETDHPFQSRLTSRTETLKELASHGDVILNELVIPPDKVAAFYRDYIKSLQNGARQCAGENPQHAALLRDYVSNHEEMCRIMEDTVDSCLWLLEKRG